MKVNARLGQACLNQLCIVTLTVHLALTTATYVLLTLWRSWISLKTVQPVCKFCDHGSYTAKLLTNVKVICVSVRRYRGHCLYVGLKRRFDVYGLGLQSVNVSER